MSVTIDQIRAAARTIEGKVLRTPCVYSGTLSDLSGADVFLKLENLQRTCSFKLRGAVNKLSSLSETERKAGVFAASAGNHAQGVAYVARSLGVPATIVMPQSAPFNKIEGADALGATVVLHGDDLSKANERALQLTKEKGGAYIHPYDDEKIIAGQGSVGLEIIEDHPGLDALIVPIGGGGLISGVAIAAKDANPNLEVFGVQAELFPSMHDALDGVGAAPPCAEQTVADGIAVKTPGEITRPIIEELVSDIFLAGESALEQAVRTFLMKQRLVVEGAGAAPLAALMENRERFKGAKVGLVVSGGNIDSSILSSILLRGLARDGHLASLRVETPDTPGLLSKVAGLIGDCGGNIVEVRHQRLFKDVPVKMTELDLVVETMGVKHVRQLMKRLNDAGHHTRLLSNLSEED